MNLRAKTDELAPKVIMGCGEIKKCLKVVTKFRDIYYTAVVKFNNTDIEFIIPEREVDTLTVDYGVEYGQIERLW